MVKFNLVSKKSAKIIGNLAKTVITQTNQLKTRLIEEMKMDVDQKVPRAIKSKDDKDIEMEEEIRESEDLSNFVSVDGVLIKQDFDHLIMEENEVDKYTSLQSATMQ